MSEADDKRFIQIKLVQCVTFYFPGINYGGKHGWDVRSSNG